MDYFDHIHPKKRPNTCLYTCNIQRDCDVCWDECCLTQLFNITHIDGCQNHRILIPPHNINEDSPSTPMYVEAAQAITIRKCIGAIEATRCWCLWFIVAS